MWVKRNEVLNSSRQRYTFFDDISLLLSSQNNAYLSDGPNSGCRQGAISIRSDMISRLELAQQFAIIHIVRQAQQ
jgi:hypothetical protein